MHHGRLSLFAAARVVGLLALGVFAGGCGGPDEEAPAPVEDDVPGLLLVDIGGPGEPDAVLGTGSPCTVDDDCPLGAPLCLPPGLCRECGSDADCHVWARCTQGACVPRLCEPGDVRCEGDLRFVCQDNGNTWSGFACVAGTCAVEGCPCPPGVGVCVDSAVWVCKADGTEYVEKTPCADNTTCVSGQCLQCLTSGELGCFGGMAVVCSPYGMWQVAEDCKSQGLACTAGSCTECDDGTFQCAGDLLRCEKEGTLSDVMDCAESGLVCYEGQCWTKCPGYDFKLGEANCASGICCKKETGKLVITGPENCGGKPGEKIVPWSLCAEPVCCQLPMGSLADLPLGSCGAVGGTVVPDVQCAEPVCCNLKDGETVIMAVGACGAAGGEPAGDPVFCVTGDCCRIEDGWQPLDAQACAAAEGTPVADIFCRNTPEWVSWTVDATIEPGVCDATSFIAVPSTNTDQVVVFDLETLEPHSKIPVCDNPSRILLDPQGFVVASCRGDGSVTRATVDGDVLWTTKLPNCNLSRGVTLTPSGQLFASCFTTNMLHGLDPTTGALLDSIALNVDQPQGWFTGSYGIASDWEAVYSVGQGALVRVDYTAAGELSIAWAVQTSFYGVAVDGIDRIWLGGAGMRSHSTLDGSLVEMWGVGGGDWIHGVGGWIHGITVGPGGLIYGAHTGSDKVLVVAPGEGVIHAHSTLPGGAGPKGVALDADGNIYAVNLLASNIMRISPEGETTLFGDGDLAGPYAYSGDMTGLTVSCVVGGSNTYESPVFSPAGPFTLWLDIVWEADEPPGTKISLSYRVGNSGWAPVGESGEVILLISPDIQLRAVLISTDGETVPTLESVSVRYIP